MNKQQAFKRPHHVGSFTLFSSALFSGHCGDGVVNSRDCAGINPNKETNTKAAVVREFLFMLVNFSDVKGSLNVPTSDLNKDGCHC